MASVFIEEVLEAREERNKQLAIKINWVNWALLRVEEYFKEWCVFDPNYYVQDKTELCRLTKFGDSVQSSEKVIIVQPVEAFAAISITTGEVKHEGSRIFSNENDSIFFDTLKRLFICIEILPGINNHA